MYAGFLNVVEIGQYFMTKDTGDMTQFHAVACREYTLPRKDGTSQPKGIPEDQLEEYALKLDAKDFACRSKAKAKPVRREPAGSSLRKVPVGKRTWIGLILNQGNILSPSTRFRRK